MTNGRDNFVDKHRGGIMKYSYIATFLIMAFISTGIYKYKDSHNPSDERTGFKTLRIAHAGGGINNKTYTNSYDALNINLKNGFLYFELDFLFTKDDELVCMHNWGNNFKQSFGFEIDEKVTLKEFEHLVDEKSEFTMCTLDGLASWMNRNPSAYIVTDAKENNIRALEMIHKTLPNANKRVIPQIYNPINFDSIAQIGFEQIIWTLYRFRGTNNTVLNWINRFHKPVAITMPKHRAKSTLPRELNKRGIPTYVHTVNTTQELEEFITKFWVTEVYTDFLPPKGIRVTHN